MNLHKYPYLHNDYNRWQCGGENQPQTRAREHTKQQHAKRSCNDLMAHSEACCTAKANKACVMKSHCQAIEKP